MMLRIYILLIFFFQMSFSLFSQTLDYSVNERLKPKVEHIEVLGKYENAYFIVQFDKKANQTFVFQRYDQSLRKTAQFIYTLERQFNVERILFVNGRIYFFYSTYDKIDNLFILYCDVFDRNFNAYDKSKVLLRTANTFPGEKAFYIKHNKQNDLLSVFYARQTNESDYATGLLLLNLMLELQGTINSELSVGKNFSIENMDFTKNYLSAILRVREPQQGLFRQTIQQFYLLCVNTINGQTNVIPLFSDSLRLNNVIFKYDYFSTSLIISGYFSENSKTESQGLAYIKYFPINDSLYTKYAFFSNEMIGMLAGSRTAADGIVDFFPVQSFMRDDGGFVFVGEYYNLRKEILSNPYSLNNTYVKYYYHFRDIMLVSFNPDGSIDWNKIIRKDQYSSNDEGIFSSFATGATHNGIIFFYNDMSRVRWHLILDKIDPSGSSEHRILVNGNTIAASFLPKSGMQVSANEFIIPLKEDRKGYSFLRVRF